MCETPTQHQGNPGTGDRVWSYHVRSTTRGNSFISACSSNHSPTSPALQFLCTGGLREPPKEQRISAAVTKAKHSPGMSTAQALCPEVLQHVLELPAWCRAWPCWDRVMCMGRSCPLAQPSGVSGSDKEWCQSGRTPHLLTHLGNVLLHNTSLWSNLRLAACQHWSFPALPGEDRLLTQVA